MTPAPVFAPIRQENIPQAIRNGSPAIDTPVTTTQQPAFAPAPPQASPFVSVQMPVDHFVTLNGKKFYSCSQLARHLCVAFETISRKCRAGEIAYVVQPGTIKKKQISEDEVRRVCVAEGC